MLDAAAKGKYGIPAIVVVGTPFPYLTLFTALVSLLTALHLLTLGQMVTFAPHAHDMLPTCYLTMSPDSHVLPLTPPNPPRPSSNQMPKNAHPTPTCPTCPAVRLTLIRKLMP